MWADSPRCAGAVSSVNQENVLTREDAAGMEHARLCVGSAVGRVPAGPLPPLSAGQQADSAVRAGRAAAGAGQYGSGLRTTTTPRLDRTHRAGTVLANHVAFCLRQGGYDAR